MEVVSRCSGCTDLRCQRRGNRRACEHAVHVAKYQESPQKQDFCADTESGIHRGLHAVMHLIDDHAQKAGIPLRFAASKIMEGDKKITEKLDLKPE